MTDLRSSWLVLSLLMVVPACSGDEFTAGSSPDSDASTEAAAGSGGGGKADASADAHEAGPGKDAGQAGNDAGPGKDGVAPGCGDQICQENENCTVCPSDCACPDACVPQCANVQCGSDSCGGSCGECPGGQTCAEGVCGVVIGCGNGVCDQTAGENCVSCPADCQCQAGQSCMGDGSCCTPACLLQGSVCGFDTCGGVSCGGPTCVNGQQCLQGQCVLSTTCGNNACDPTETCESCNWDCKCPVGKCTAGGICK